MAKPTAKLVGFREFERRGPLGPRVRAEFRRIHELTRESVLNVDRFEDGEYVVSVVKSIERLLDWIRKMVDDREE